MWHDGRIAPIILHPLKKKSQWFKTPDVSAKDPCIFGVSNCLRVSWQLQLFSWGRKKIVHFDWNYHVIFFHFVCGLFFFEYFHFVF
jgi:hypothetical protein